MAENKVVRVRLNTSEMYRLCEDIKDNEHEYQGLSLARMCERATKLIGKPVSDSSIKTASEACGVDLFYRDKGRTYPALKDRLDKIEQAIKYLSYHTPGVNPESIFEDCDKLDTTDPD